MLNSTTKERSPFLAGPVPTESLKITWSFVTDDAEGADLRPRNVALLRVPKPRKEGSK